MTVLSGGMSDGHLWVMVDVEVMGMAIRTLRPMLAMTHADLWPLVDEQDCPGHIASVGDAKICGRCGVHIDSLRLMEDDRC